jgi:hypothetical protein
VLWGLLVQGERLMIVGQITVVMFVMLVWVDVDKG